MIDKIQKYRNPTEIVTKKVLNFEIKSFISIPSIPLLSLLPPLQQQPSGGHVPVDVYYFTVVYRNVFLNSQEEEIRKPLFCA